MPLSDPSKVPMPRREASKRKKKPSRRALLQNSEADRDIATQSSARPAPAAATAGDSEERDPHIGTVVPIHDLRASTSASRHKRKHDNAAENAPPDCDRESAQQQQELVPVKRQKQKPVKMPAPLLSRLRQILDPVTFLLIRDIAAGERNTPLCITSITQLPAVCQAFGLIHPSLSSYLPDASDYPAPLVAAPPTLPEALAWQVPEADIESWLVNELPDIPIKARLAEVLTPGATLPTFSYMYQTTVERRKEASCRPMVDMILMTAICILNGVEASYLQSYVNPAKQTLTRSDSQSRTRKLTPNKYRNLKLHYELDLEYTDDSEAGTTYSGRVDWGIGVNNRASLESSAVGRSSAGYRSILAVIEAKVPDSLSRATSQVLAYMGCLLRIREQVGARRDLSTYGVATDGYNWQFYRISPTEDPWESAPPSRCRYLARVQQTSVYDIFKRKHLAYVLCHIMYIIVQSIETLTPTTSPEKATDADASAGGGVASTFIDDGLILHASRAPEVDSALHTLLEDGEDVLDRNNTGKGGR